jgi:hypothetical protein
MTRALVAGSQEADPHRVTAQQRVVEEKIVRQRAEGALAAESVEDGQGLKKPSIGTNPPL